uniref:Phosphoprotein n=1 Tax=Human parainfluenza 2 virus TaxID=2560525 RepID=A0A1Z1W0R3_PI2H|nr:P protein [Human orthorubulavirus 2]QEO75966.1 P protein [Human orthorubulavirus 2]QQY99184.1 P protein [Human orthorubulavirus 2]
MAEEPTYTTEQVDELIHAGLGTVDFFLSRPIDAQSSLGKGSIPPGVTAVLTNAAEAKSKPVAAGPVKPRRKKVISNTTPYTIADNIPPEKLPINTPIPNPLLPLARPHGKMTDIDIVTGNITEGSYKGVELAKLGKQTLLTRFTSNMSQSPQLDLPKTPTLRGGELIEKEQEATIGENGVLHGSEIRSKSSSGVIPGVPQSRLQLASSPAHVDPAPASAENVKEIIELLKGLDLRLQTVEGKVDKILATSATIINLKNEMTSLKASVATVEGMITTIKIMDPSTPTNVPVEEIRKSLHNVPVVIAGPTSGGFTAEGSDMISMDELARPTLSSTKKITRKPESKKDLTGIKLTLMQLANDCISRPDTKTEFVTKIQAATTESQLNEIKRSIIRSAI